MNFSSHIDLNSMALEVLKFHKTMFCTFMLFRKGWPHRWNVFLSPFWQTKAGFARP